MGDVIHALPAVAALRAAHPDVNIGWVIEQRWQELLRASQGDCSPQGKMCGDGAVPRPNPAKPLVNSIHPVNTIAWRKSLLSDETWKESVAAIRSIRAAKYDIAVDFQGAWKSAFIAQLSGASDRIGFSHPRETGAALFYTSKITVTRPHVIEQNLELAAVLGAAPVQHSTQLLPVDRAAESWAEATLRQLFPPRKEEPEGAPSLRSRGGDFVLINPGAGWGAKCWPAENYAAVARGLSDFGLHSLINFGPAEQSLANAVVSASAGSAVALPCSISELIAITRRASLFIGGDTGPMHLAAALQVPVVGIFGPTDPTRNGPYGTKSVVLRRNASVTDHSHHSRPDEAMLTITPEEVLSAAAQLLQSSVSGARNA